MRKRKIVIKPKAIMISAKGRNEPPSTLVQKNKDEEKHACNTFYGQHVQLAKLSMLWIKRITKETSKNKSKDEENIHSKMKS